MEFKSFEEAVEASMAAEPLSDEWRKAMAYAVTNAPAPLQALINKQIKEFFPDLKPDYFDAHGNPFYAVDKLCKYFDVSKEQAEEIAENHPEVIRDNTDGLFRPQ
jgi:hypothetical protein